jgi:type IV secretory pathway TraG/TraD family ATPase VirD4
MLNQSTREELKEYLDGKNSAEHFSKDNAKVAASIMSVLKTNIKPLRFLSDSRKAGKFSIQQYLKDVDAGSDSWLFLANEPSTRELTIPINAALAELVVANLMRHNRPENSKIWFMMDELGAFGKFPSLLKLLREGRKYGICVMAGMQSSSQLFARYGQGDASDIFALFKTKFAFQSDDPMMGKLYSSICGSETVTRQQKNTSFGANTFRDGVSYNEQQQEKPLVKIDDFANLSLGECYTLLPLPEVRLSKMLTPEATVKDINPGFVEQEELDVNDVSQNQLNKDDELAIENIEYQVSFEERNRLSKLKQEEIEIPEESEPKLDEEIIINDTNKGVSSLDM